jgi:hypothetical protein
VKVVVDLLPKCAAHLLSSTNWILSIFHPFLAKAHVLKLVEVRGPTDAPLVT